MNVTKPDTAAVTGLLRCLRSEKPSLCLYTLDIDGDTDIASPNASESVIKVSQAVFETASVCPETKWAEANGRLFVPRLYEQKAMNELLVSIHTFPNLVRRFCGGAKHVLLGLKAPSRSRDRVWDASV